MRHHQSITSLPRAPEADRHSRMLKYSIAMGIRFVCIGLCLVVHGWWLVVCAIGAIALPYFAVVIANARGGVDSPVERPGNIVLRGSGSDGADRPADGESAGQSAAGQADGSDAG